MDEQPFEALRDEGLLWLINRAVFHPRGYALGLHFDPDGRATGWSLIGDGSEPWSFISNDREDECFKAVETLFERLRDGDMHPATRRRWEAAMSDEDAELNCRICHQQVHPGPHWTLDNGWPVHAACLVEP
jgi:hypothetical protein